MRCDCARPRSTALCFPHPLAGTAPTASRVRPRAEAEPDTTLIGALLMLLNPSLMFHQAVGKGKPYYDPSRTEVKAPLKAMETDSISAPSSRLSSSYPGGRVSRFHVVATCRSLTKRASDCLLYSPPFLTAPPPASLGAYFIGVLISSV
jgi:hypothetical protein